MFIPEIYKALQEGKNVILIGPQGCGKSTVLKGITRDVVRKKVRYEHMGIINRLSNPREKPEHTVILIDGMPPEEMLEKIKILCSDNVGLQFIFPTSEGKCPDCLMESRRFAIIGWPASECPP